MDRKARTADLLKGLVAETQCESFYFDAFAKLRSVLAGIFGNDAVPRSIGAKEGQPAPDQATFNDQPARRPIGATSATGAYTGSSSAEHSFTPLSGRPQC